MPYSYQCRQNLYPIQVNQDTALRLLMLHRNTSVAINLAISQTRVPQSNTSVASNLAISQTLNDTSVAFNLAISQTLNATKEHKRSYQPSYSSDSKCHTWTQGNVKPWTFSVGP